MKVDNFSLNNPDLKLKRVSIFKIFWFSKLNMKIHQQDPIFTTANETNWSRFKFLLSFAFKSLFHHRFIMIEKNNVAGALSLDKKRISVFVYAIGLLPEFRRKGYGTLLMEFAEYFARKNNKDIVNFSVLLENKPAVKFYEKLGYKPQGIGLTIIRCLRRKLFAIDNADEASIQEESIIYFESINRKKTIETKAKYWWLKEISFSAGKTAKNLTKKEKMLEFEPKLGWKAYKIINSNLEVGFITILPFDLIPTFVLFSDAEKTWNVVWLKKLLQQLEKSQLLRIMKKSKSLLNLKEDTLSSSFFQFFVTHQHKDALLEYNQKNNMVFIHDSNQDRQIYFKKLDNKERT